MKKHKDNCWCNGRIWACSVFKNAEEERQELQPKLDVLDLASLLEETFRRVEGAICLNKDYKPTSNQLREFYKAGYFDVIIIASAYREGGMDLKTFLPNFETNPDEIIYHLEKLIDKIRANMPPPPDDSGDLDTDFENADEESSGHA